MTSRKAISPSVVKADKLNSSDTPVNSASMVTNAALIKKELIANVKRLSKQYRVSSDKKFKLKDFPTNESPSVTKPNKPLPQDTLQQGVQ